MLAQPQLPDDARRLAFVPMQSAEPFRSGRELWEGQWELCRWRHVTHEVTDSW